MLDQEIRGYLRKNYLQRYYQDPNSKVVEEMALFANRARIDIAVINGHLLGYEIKSDRDTIGRLPDQVAVYGQIFDFTSVISGPKHINKLIDFLPHYCGLVLSEPHNGEIKLTMVVEPSYSTDLSAFHIASLLWHDEACSLLKGIGLGKGVRKKRIGQLWGELAEAFTIKDLTNHVRSKLKARKAWKEIPTPIGCDD
jgi:hypothetical protein